MHENIMHEKDPHQAKHNSKVLQTSRDKEKVFKAFRRKRNTYKGMRVNMAPGS